MNFDNFKNYHNAVIAERMIDKIDILILRASNGSKKEMLIDALRVCRKVCDASKNSEKRIEYLLYLNTKLEFDNDVCKISIKERDIKIEKLEKQIKEMLK